MTRRRTMRAARAQGQQVAQEITVPIPLNGLFVEAKTAEVSGLFAAELLNMRSTGVVLESVKGYRTGDASNLALRRIRFEFGAFSHYIEIQDSRINAGIATFERSVDPQASVAYISSQAILADGGGQPIRYDGTSFTESAFTTTTGDDPAGFDGVIAHHDRLYFWKSDGDLEFYYGDVGAVTGALTRFPLGRLGNITGKIAAVASLTVDASNNLNDRLCIMTTTGEIVIYEGLDPGDANDWRMSARVQGSPPLSKDSFTRIGGDLWMLSASGLVSVMESVRQGMLALVSSLSRPIAERLQEMVIAENGVWQLHTSKFGDMVIINWAGDGVSEQFIYHTGSKTWGTASYPAEFWHNLGLKTEFTTHDGVLCTIEMSDGDSDLISARWVSSWFRLKRHSEIKFLIPTIIAYSPLTVTVTVLSDHDDSAVDIAEATQVIELVPDNDADPGQKISLDDLIGIDAVGSSFQIRMEIEAPWFQIVNMTAGVL